jgi:hypothetical protein
MCGEWVPLLRENIFPTPKTMVEKTETMVGRTKTVVGTPNTMVEETNTTVGTTNSMVVATNTMVSAIGTKVTAAKKMVSVVPTMVCKVLPIGFMLEQSFANTQLVVFGAHSPLTSFLLREIHHRIRLTIHRICQLSQILLMEADSRAIKSKRPLS